MPRTLILHIGTMKTGSTAIQHALSSNREAMLARGVCYPGPPDAMHHLLFAMLFTSFRDAYADFGNVLWRGRDPQLLLQEYRQGFTAEIAALPEHVGRVIVSSEQLGQLVREGEDIARLRAEMAELFDDFRIIVYLRRQDSHFISSYSQTLRNGMIRKPAFRRLREHRHVYDYHALLDAWAAVFGQDAVLPRIFENSPGAPFDVVADFLSVTGLDGLAVKPCQAAAGNPPAPRRRNSSPASPTATRRCGAAGSPTGQACSPPTSPTCRSGRSTPNSIPKAPPRYCCTCCNRRWTGSRRPQRPRSEPSNRTIAPAG
jgi:hypothetical protein